MARQKLLASEDRIQVVVRVRPVLENDGDESPAVTCDPTKSRVQVLAPQRDAKDSISRGSGTAARQFSFDAALGASASQTDVYNACNIERLVNSALEGYSVTIFAFGQTGAGKTFSLAGPSGKGLRAPSSDLKLNDGIIARALRYLYDAADADTEASHQIRGCFSEIYNEQVRDLLADTPAPLQVRHNQRMGFFVDGLTSKPIPTLGEAQQAVITSLTNRI
eukprot:9225848-Pyramimonas_sp.AAC.1